MAAIDIAGIAHGSSERIGDGLTFSPPFSLDPALSLWVRKPALRSLPPLGERSLLQLSFSKEIDVVCI